MTEPRESALDLLARYEQEVEFLSDAAAVEAMSARLRDDLEGTVDIDRERGPIGESSDRGPATGPEAVAADLAFEPGIALCLSGGGYKAMLFNAGRSSG